MDIKLNVAIYCRLSREDGDSIESSSIKTQKDILTEYANTNNWNIYKYYVDDGYSGAHPGKFPRAPQQNAPRFALQPGDCSAWHEHRRF